MVLADDFGQGEAPGSKAVSFLYEGVFHSISPGNCWCAQGHKQSQPSLANCLAVENNPLLIQVMAQMNDVKVIFINAHDTVMVTEQQKYEQMSLYRQMIHLPETRFTNRSLVLLLLLVV